MSLGHGAQIAADGPSPPLVLVPAVLARLPAVADDRVPQSVGFGLVVGRHLEREGCAVWKERAAVQADAGHAHHG